MQRKEQAGREPSTVKAIPPARDRMQSDLLVGCIGLLLGAKAAIQIVQLRSLGPLPAWLWISIGVSIGFAVLVWLLRSATGPAACLGGCICLNVLLRQEFAFGWRETAMPSLLVLFVLTFAATRFGRARKESLGLAEPKRGRRASQVVANLGVAGLCALGTAPHGSGFGTGALFAAAIAALAEATADTLSSEMGQVLGGTTLLITTGRPVPRGTDGGISLAGTACGVLGAAVVVLVSPFAGNSYLMLACFAGGCVGLFFDSLLGATVERRGWLGNDLVNFLSTAVAALVAYLAVRLFS